MPFQFSEEHLSEMFALANLEVPSNEMVFFALRGCSPVDDDGTPMAKSHALQITPIDHIHMRCTFGQWIPGKGISVFPGSTVPHVSNVKARISQGGRGVNMLALGYYRNNHRYYKGDHKLASPNNRHRAFRNDSPLPVWRTADDADYESDDRLSYEVVVDNIHCAYQMNVAASSFSSSGCQVIAGLPRILARGWNDERGPWARFVDQAYSLDQQRFCYALFSGHEAAKTVTLGASSRGQTVRFGSTGPLVKAVQEALIAHQYDIGSETADGVCGFGTLSAIRRFQTDKLGTQNADLIVGAATAQELGLDWSDHKGPAPTQALVASAAGALPPTAAQAADGPSNGTYNEKYKTTFRSLVPGGFYSHDPDDMKVRRAIRSNNPGALNFRPWQQDLPGYVGVTQADKAGNITTIYDAPEHGVAAWYYLITKKYGYGAKGELRIGDLARKYAGAAKETDPSVKDYIAGWRRASAQVIDAATIINFKSESDILLLARAMFFHEIGAKSPLHDDQITFGVKLRTDT